MPEPVSDDLAAPLARMGLISGPFTAARLSGGVSCDVWKVEPAGRAPFVVKRALAKLRVAADWQAPPERWKAEVAWLKLAHGIDAATAPRVLGEDAASGLFALEWRDGPVWKAELAAGRVDVHFAATVGRKLAAIHAATAGRADIAKAFDNGAHFFALRLDAYLLFTAGRHPDVAKDIRKEVQRISLARIALMQGDISPKNILVGKDGPVFIDAETACYGDPVFDLAFCLNHLLLKCVWHPQFTEQYLAGFRALVAAYRTGVTWENAAELEKRTARLLAMLLLARVDGKSPAEYLTDPRDHALVRDTAKDFIYGEEESLETMALVWKMRLPPHSGIVRRP
jgi:aminoglycoside phosphotransferase (APT) family kinase protein